MRVDVYDRMGAFVGAIPPKQLLGFTHTDELNGEDSVSISTLVHLREGYRLVWADRTGKVHEHVCQDPKGLHDRGDTVYTDTALNSICETFGDYIEDKRPSGSWRKVLETVLEPTRWSVGTVDMQGVLTTSFYHVSSREALQSILESGGELETSVKVGKDGVETRAVSILSHRGDTSGHRRFAYGKDIVSVSKTEHWDAITACYGYGKGLETEAGGYSRKLTFADINNGKAYVEDAEALKTYGRPDGNGGLAHVFGTFEDEDCEDAEQLLDETTAYLREHSVPGVTYEADVIDLVQFGRDWEGVGVGDDVQIVDAEYSPELRLQGRVTRLVRDCLTGGMEVTLGNVTETMGDMMQRQQQAVASLSRRSGSWDVAAYTPASYLKQLMDGLNEQFNLKGMSYRYDSYETGTTYASVPMDEDGKPTEDGGWAMNLCSYGFRIASGRKADGSWDWRTFGTGEGFSAEMITVGQMSGERIDAETINAKELKADDIKIKKLWSADEDAYSITDNTKFTMSDVVSQNSSGTRYYLYLGDSTTAQYIGDIGFFVHQNGETYGGVYIHQSEDGSTGNPLVSREPHKGASGDYIPTVVLASESTASTYGKATHMALNREGLTLYIDGQSAERGADSALKFFGSESLVFGSTLSISCTGGISTLYYERQLHITPGSTEVIAHIPDEQAYMRPPESLPNSEVIGRVTAQGSTMPVVMRVTSDGDISLENWSDEHIPTDLASMVWFTCSMSWPANI